MARQELRQFYHLEIETMIKELCINSARRLVGLNQINTGTAMRLDKQIKKTKPVILTLNYNEFYLSNMIRLLDEYTVVVYECNGSKPFFGVGKTVNAHKTKEITPDIIPDVVVCQCVEYHYETCRDIANTYGCPLVVVEHEAPNKNYGIHNHIECEKVIFYSNEHYGLWVPNNSATTKQTIKNADVIKPTYFADAKQIGMLYVNHSASLSSINEILHAMGKANCVVVPAIWENMKAICNHFSGLLYNQDAKTSNDSFAKIVQNVSNNYPLRKTIGKNAAESVGISYSNEDFRKNWYRILDGVIR